MNQHLHWLDANLYRLRTVHPICSTSHDTEVMAATILSLPRYRSFLPSSRSVQLATLTFSQPPYPSPPQHTPSLTSLISPISLPQSLQSKPDCSESIKVSVKPQNALEGKEEDSRGDAPCQRDFNPGNRSDSGCADVVVIEIPSS